MDGRGAHNRILADQRSAVIEAVLAVSEAPGGVSGKDAVARTLHLPLGTVNSWIDRNRPVLQGLRRYNRGYHQDLLADRTIGLLERIDPDSPQDANEIKCLAIATGILSDKLLLLQGAPTSIIGHLEPRRERVLEAAKLLAKLQSQLPSGDSVSPVACEPG